MAHISINQKSRKRELETHSLLTTRNSVLKNEDTSLFYELEEAVVIDVIRDETHPVFTQNENSPKINRATWPTGYNDPSIPDYSWIGRIKARLIHSQTETTIDNLDWITPLETNLFEYPLVNELVVVSSYLGRSYYSRRVNYRNFINNGADFQLEHRYGMGTGVNEQTSPGSLKSARNESNLWPDTNKYGNPKPFLGKYFKANNKIRPLKHFEGDTILQSRFGSSIRFGCYENDPNIDSGTSNGYGESYADNLGNPMILIRNRQKKTEEKEKQYQFNILEDVNKDGSSIQITSGKTISKFIPTLTHVYDNVPYRRRGCVHKTFSGFDRIANSNIGKRTDLIDRALRD